MGALISGGEKRGTDTHCHTIVIYDVDDAGQKTRLNSFHLVWQQQASLQKLGPIKFLIGSCTDLNVDSGSDSCSKFFHHKMAI